MCHYECLNDPHFRSALACRALNGHVLFLNIYLWAEPAGFATLLSTVCARSHRELLTISSHLGINSTQQMVGARDTFVGVRHCCVRLVCLRQVLLRQRLNPTCTLDPGHIQSSQQRGSPGASFLRRCILGYQRTKQRGGQHFAPPSVHSLCALRAVPPSSRRSVYDSRSVFRAEASAAQPPEADVSKRAIPPISDIPLSKASPRLL